MVRFVPLTMKKNSGKKSVQSKTAPVRSPKREPQRKAVISSQASPAANQQVPRTTPFEPFAASPLSKEARSASSQIQSKVPATPAVPASTRRQSPADSPVPAGPSSKTLVDIKPEPKAAAKSPKSKPGKRPVRNADRAKPEVKIPAILLEGDLPPSPAISGPGARYALAPTPVAAREIGGAGELPEAYGTGRVFLAARDPHWLYVSWDFAIDQQNRLNASSRDGHLIVKVFAAATHNLIVPEVHVHPESRNWFVHVPHAETLYRAEIGIYDHTGLWRTAAASQNTFTPSEAPSTDLTARFATIPAEVTFQQVVAAVQQFVNVSKNEPLLGAVAQAAAVQKEHPTPHVSRIAPPSPNLPRTSVTRIGPPPRRPSPRSRPQVIPRPERLPVELSAGGSWSEEQTRELTKLIHIDSFRRVWLGSMEITELVRLRLQEEIASIAAAEAKRAIRGEAVAARPSEMNVSSPLGGDFKKPSRFWFKINAELIIYGATEPDASVTIADRPVKLRPDGTFSFRFSLPDGRYQLPAMAISSNREDGREARLEFSRSTEYRGHVEAHPQHSALRPPKGDVS